MRNLQRLTHLRPLPSEAHAEVQFEERRDVKRRQRHQWRRKLRSLVLLLVIAGPLALGGFVAFNLHPLADALVVTAPVVARAPAAVRVAEVLCAPGQRCRAGQPLARLEPLARDAGREVLAARVEARRLRLGLLAAGGRVDVTGRLEERDLALEAGREAELAAADLLVAEARLALLARSRARRSVELRGDQQVLAGAVAELAERLSAAQAMQRAAAAALRPAELEAHSTERLIAGGIVSEREQAARLAERDVARFDVEERSALARALSRELETAEQRAGLGAELTAATLAELDAAIEAAEGELDAAGRRAELWREAERHYREQRSQTSLPLPEQRAYELALLATEVREAEGALAAWDEARGDVVLRAEMDGTIDRVAVRAGSVVEEGAVLVTYYDPAALEVVAYAAPRLVERLVPGAGVRLVPHGGNVVLEAELALVGRSWVRCPPELPQRDEPGADLRLPVTISCTDVDVLRPGMRLRARFEDLSGSFPARVVRALGF